MSSETTPEMLWESFLALRRYDRKANRHQEPLPGAMPPRMTARLGKCAAYIDSTLQSYPLLLSAEYISYLFLFTQWQRISFTLAPRYVPQEGWYNLRPTPPLTALTAINEAARRAWLRWLTQATFLPPSQIEAVYPRFTGPGEIRVQATRHLTMATRYSQQRDGNMLWVLRNVDITGNVTDHSNPVLEWHPWVRLAYMVGSKPQLAHIAFEVFSLEETGQMFFDWAPTAKRTLLRQIEVILQDNPQAALALKLMKKIARRSLRSRA